MCSAISAGGLHTLNTVELKNWRLLWKPRVRGSEGVVARSWPKSDYLPATWNSPPLFRGESQVSIGNYNNECTKGNQASPTESETIRIWIGGQPISYIKSSHNITVMAASEGERN